MNIFSYPVARWPSECVSVSPETPLIVAMAVLPINTRQYSLAVLSVIPHDTLMEVRRNIQKSSTLLR